MIDFSSHLIRFCSFVDEFCSKNPEDQENIDLKKNHSLRVYQEAKHLTACLDAPERYIQLSRLTALYHDIGRFPQYFQYGSFNDKITVNHGLMGYKTLKNNSFLSGISAKERKTVLFGVLNHNRAKIPKALPESNLFVLEVVRDSDKLDIMNVLLAYFEDEANSNSVVTLGLDSHPDKYSQKVVDSLLSGKLVDYQDLVWINDFKLMLLSWVHDFNFSHTQSQVINRGYMERVLSLLPGTADIRDVKDRIYSCMYINQSPTA